MKKLILLLAITGLISACGKKTKTDDEVNALSVDPVEATVESGITIVSAMADDQSGSSYAFQTKPSKSIWEVLLGQKAYAAACARAFFSSCDSGIKSAIYNACEISGTAYSITGQVSLTYSNASCALANDGDYVNRTFDLDISGPRGGVVSHSSANASDYRGTSYGGGGQLTKTSSGWEIDVLGRHSAMTFRNRNLYNVSVRTLSPINITGSLSRTARVVSGGQLEVNHNLAEFTAVFTPTDLAWNGSCCHPVSGSIAVNYSGSKTGSATVTFNGCGSASIDEDGQQRTIEFSYCE
jgi:hypothetical protein